MSQPEVSPEDQAEYMRIMAEYDECMRQEAIRIGQRKAADHHTKCRDCGAFTDKSRWVKKGSPEDIKRQARPLCVTCADEYDYDY